MLPSPEPESRSWWEPGAAVGWAIAQGLPREAESGAREWI